MPNRVFGISGPQGSGKGTLLEGLRGRGFEVDDFKVSRTVQQELGWASLDRVLDDPEMMMDFQMRVVERKYENDRSLQGPILVERTFADIFVYTKLWCQKFFDLGKIDEVEQFYILNSMLALCLDRQRKVYNGVIMVPFMDHMPWDNDPNRAKREDIQWVQQELRRFFMKSSVPCIPITQPSVDGRVNESEHFISMLDELASNRERLSNNG